MNLKTVFSLVFVLSLGLVLVPMVNAECVELKYDDGASEVSGSNVKGHQYGVKFSLPAISAKLVKARFEISINPSDFMVHVYDLEGNDLISPLLVTEVSSGWVDVPLGVWVSDDFFVALELLEDSKPYIAEDASIVQGYSFQRATSTDSWQPNSDGNYMIRAVVCYRAVGGELLLNIIPTIASWLILGVSITVITVGLAYARTYLNIKKQVR